MESYEKLNFFVKNSQNHRGNNVSLCRTDTAYTIYKSSSIWDVAIYCAIINEKSNCQLISKLAHDVHYNKEFLIPAYEWIEEWLCENTLDFRYSKFVIGLSVCMDNYGWHFMEYADVKMSKFAKLFVYEYREIIITPQDLIRIGTKTTYLKKNTYFHLENTIMAIIYVPYLRVTSA
jgi:hypothetical protein